MAGTCSGARCGRPLKIVVTFTTGGAPDILARLIGDRLTADWGQPVVVDNKPGAGGNTGAGQTVNQNVAESVDVFGMPLQRRFSLAIRLGY